ncbi:GIY-YIG nuclease family protein [Wenyingzhuangia aestuarii]|uniref:GIY-YIG nuclease family protein n=1 Tax=Wenyingzhuangia aestuarii TaxID=1647582 RepID=UPI00143C2128|nr:GIY-YIG nuclease family protein [Wenyingzhuangia aestuarii]NJB82684.1 putative endonuclease [Wenyingzhuangia aestuarii]
MPGYVYILECSDGTYYTGSTRNLERRLAEHQSKKGANYTKTRLPVKLVFQEEFLNIADAFYYEKKIKKWSQAKKKAMIENNWKLLPLLSECKNDTHFKHHKET